MLYKRKKIQYQRQIKNKISKRNKANNNSSRFLLNLENFLGFNFPTKNKNLKNRLISNNKGPKLQVCIQDKNSNLKIFQYGN